MRSCHPRDLVAQVVDMCRYQNKAPHITRELLDQACRNYFLDEQASKQAPRGRSRPGAEARTARARVAPPVARPPREAAPAGQPRTEEWLS